MIYIKVNWSHSFVDDPILIYSEINSMRFEVRKVEVFSDGRKHYADENGSYGSSRLGKVAVPHIEEINGGPEFVAYEISKEDFEKIWELRLV